jgi:hypothetical protein
VRYALAPFAPDGLWDGRSVETLYRRAADGGVCGLLGAGLRTQLRLMVDEGCLPGVRLARSKQEREAVTIMRRMRKLNARSCTRSLMSVISICQSSAR